MARTIRHLTLMAVYGLPWLLVECSLALVPGIGAGHVLTLAGVSCAMGRRIPVFWVCMVWPWF